VKEVMNCLGKAVEKNRQKAEKAEGNSEQIKDL